MSDVIALVKQMNAEWTAFKAENNRRLAEIEKTGRTDPLTEEKIERHSKAIGEIQAQLDEVQLAAQRKAAAGVPADESEQKKAEHRKAFSAFVRKGDESAIQRIQASLSTDSDPDGGYTVPAEMDAEIEKYERDNTPMRQAARVITVSSEKYEKLVKQGSAGSGWVGERESRSETDAATWELLKPFFGEIYAKPKVTQKILDDSEINIESELAEDIGIEFAEKENDAFTLGNGVKKPKGLLGYTLNTQADGARAVDALEKLTSGTSGGIGSADKLIELVHKLHPGYRTGAIWMLSSLTLAAIRKLKDASGVYLFQPSMFAGQPASILGYDILENESMPDPAADSNSIVFGNIRRAYQVVDVVGTRVLRDPFTEKPFVVFYTTKRVGGFLVNNRAVKVLTLSA